MASGPRAGLELVDQRVSEPSLARYHLLPSVRGDFLHKLGRFEEAGAEFERAAAMTRNERERALMVERARELRVRSAVMRRLERRCRRLKGSAQINVEFHRIPDLTARGGARGCVGRP